METMLMQNFGGTNKEYYRIQTNFDLRFVLKRSILSLQ